MACSPEDGADHYVYADPGADKAVGDLYETEETKQMIETGTSSSCEMGTSYEPPEESKEQDTVTDMMKVFE